MPIIKSAKKRVKVAKKAAVRNSKTRRSLKAAIKAFETKSTADNLRKAQSALDIAVKKNVIHKNKAARKKAQLAAEAKKSGVKVTAAKKSPTNKPVAKKSAANKAPTKKPAAKKPAVKKTSKK